MPQSIAAAAATLEAAPLAEMVPPKKNPTSGALCTPLAASAHVRADGGGELGGGLVLAAAAAAAPNRITGDGDDTHWIR